LTESSIRRLTLIASRRRPH